MTEKIPRYVDPYAELTELSKPFEDRQLSTEDQREEIRFTKFALGNPRPDDVEERLKEDEIGTVERIFERILPQPRG